MILYYVIIFGLLCIGIRLRNKVSLDESLSISQSNVIKGFFILWVFILHLIPYLKESGYAFDGLGDTLLSPLNIGQYVVAMFLLYSGYGVCQQVLTRSEDYLQKMPRKRILATLLNFDVAVLCFLMISLIMHRHYPLRMILLSLVGWESLGNSNWYIFDIIALYILVWLAHVSVKNRIGQWSLFSALVLIFVLAMCLTRPFWWSDTILCFWCGYTLSCFKERLQALLEKHWWHALAVAIFAYIFIHVCHLVLCRFYHAGFIPGWLVLSWLWMNIKHMTLALGIVLLTMRFGCQSRPLEWCGKHLFPIYIYQRLPMMALPASFIQAEPLGYFAFCLAMTLAIASLYRYWQIKL